MKKLVLLVILLLPLAAMIACGTAGAARMAVVEVTTVELGQDIDFSDVMNRDWILSEIRTFSETVVLDRERHIEEGFGNIFTLRIEDTLVFGTAMPNSFRGPYTLADNQAITFGPMATTMMAAFREPEELTEHEFFVHMGNVVGWDLVGERLELHANGENYPGAVLVFVLLEDLED